MKKPRLYRWRWLLALLLGAGTWWGVGWWLGPRPYWEADYNPFHFRQSTREPGIGKFIDPTIDEQTDHIREPLDFAILDSQGRYLLIEQTYGPGPFSYEVIDLFERKRVAKHIGMEPRKFFGPDRNYGRLVNSEGISFFVYHRKVESPGNYLQTRLYQPELWLWNVITNDVKLLKSYKVGMEASVSRDGSTLLEIERVTALTPSMLLPMSLPNCLSGQFESFLQYSDLSVIRIRDLPSMQLRSTLVLPWLRHQTYARLSPDGTLLVLSDNFLTTGMTSAYVVRDVKRDELWYAASPPGCFIVDTSTLQLKAETSRFPGIYFPNSFCEHRDFICFMGGESFGERKGLIFHLPTQSWRVGRPFTEVRTFQDSYQTTYFLDWQDDQAIRYEVEVIAKDGKVRKVEAVKGSDNQSPYKQLLPNNPQYVVMYRNCKADRIPAWLLTHLDKIDSLTRWLHDDWQHLEVHDHEKNRMLVHLKTRDAYEYECVVSDHWVVFIENAFQNYHVAVYALPFPSWSPLWPWAAAFLVVLLTIYILRQRHPQRG